MEDKLYYRELECYGKAPEPLPGVSGKNDFLDLALLPTKTMREEFRRYFLYRGAQVSLDTIQDEKSLLSQFCQALGMRRTIPESLLDWEEKEWVRILKTWMLGNGIALSKEKKSVYGTINVVEARLIRFLRKVYRFLMPEDTREEWEKDIWRLDRMDLRIRENPVYKTQTLNFTGIRQEKIREEVKLAVYQHLKCLKIGTVKRELTSLRQFSKYLTDKHKKIQSCAEIDRPLLEEYLIFKATSGNHGRGNSENILALRTVLESVGKICGYPHLEKLFMNTDIPPEIQPEFRAYSDDELKRLNAHITKLDEQIARCMVIHQMLGTRISDTLTLQTDCLSQQDGVDMPLRYNNDKRKKPLFSRGLSVCRHLFNSFSKLKCDEKIIEKRRLFH